VIGIGKPMPGVSWNENRSALLKRVRHIVQRDNPTAFQNVEGFIHLEVSVNRNACTERHLLG
jgi:hypothetical protein